MSAPLNNKYWKLRGKHGRDHKYTPETLWKEAVGYFEWIEENSLVEEKGYSYMGQVTKEQFKKIRAMTIIGFCLYADIDETTLWNYEKENEDFFNVIKAIKNIIYEQKFTGAAADLLNANIISRELGLVDRIQQENTGSMTQRIIVTSKEDIKEIENLKDKFENENCE